MLKKWIFCSIATCAFVISANALTVPSNTNSLEAQYFFKKVEKFNIGTPPAKIIAEYPLIKKQANLPAARDFNQLMANTVDGIINNFNFEVQKMEVNHKATSNLTVHYKITFFKPDSIVSVQLIVDKFFGDAAHPDEYTYSINYNLAELSALSLDRLFKENKPYLKIIAQYCRDQLKKRNLGKYATIDQSTRPIPENYLVELTPDGLLITFDAYLVAPYVYGKQVVTIPFTLLKPCMLSTYQTI